MPLQKLEEGDQFSDHFFLGHLQSVQGNDAWYYNLRFIGRGGNGTAFLVSCSSGENFGLQLVLKVFHRVSDDQRRNAFLQEIRYLRTLDHPAIVDIYDEGEFKIGNRVYPFAVMEYVPRTARQLLATRPLDRLHTIRIASNCLSALKHLHTAERPLIHRDLKPENILISQATAKLADFGLAKAVGANDVPEPTDIEAPEGSHWPGMPHRYRTPELIQRARDGVTEITTASDIYQFGTVFYELLTGFNPQEAPADVLDDIKLDVRDIPGSQGQQLKKLITNMLVAKPTGRPSADDCLQKLNKIHRLVCKEIAKVIGHPR